MQHRVESQSLAYVWAGRVRAIEGGYREQEVAGQKQNGPKQRRNVREREGEGEVFIQRFFFFLTTAFQTYPDRTNFRNIKHLYIFWSNCFGEQSLTIH